MHNVTFLFHHPNTTFWPINIRRWELVISSENATLFNPPLYIWNPITAALHIAQICRGDKNFTSKIAKEVNVVQSLYLSLPDNLPTNENLLPLIYLYTRTRTTITTTTCTSILRTYSKIARIIKVKNVGERLPPPSPLSRKTKQLRKDAARRKAPSKLFLPPVFRLLTC